MSVNIEKVSCVVTCVVFMINDNSSVPVIMKMLNTNKNCFFLFDPQKTHYTNTMTIFRALRKNVFERYYEQRSRSANKKDKKTLGKNSFSKCKTPLDIFHRQRNVMLNISQEIGRIGYLVEKDYNLVIQGDNKPEISNLKSVIQEKAKEFNQIGKYKSPDYFLPANMLYGLVSSQQWQKKGIEILTLEGRLIYPLYGVWAPTSQEYLGLIDLYMKSVKEPAEINNVVDLGCGTGILGILAGSYGTSGELLAIDNQPNAIE